MKILIDVPKEIHYEVKRLADLDSLENGKKFVKEKYVELIKEGLKHIKKLKLK